MSAKENVRHSTWLVTRIQTRTDPQVSTAVAFGDVGEVVEQRAGKRRLPRLGVDLEYFAPCGFVRKREEELAVEATGPTESRVDRIWPVGRTNDDDLAATVHAVHKRK